MTTPVRRSQWGLQKQLGKAENFLEVLTASELSHKPGQVNGGTEKLLVFQQTAALSCGYNSEQQEALSI